MYRDLKLRLNIFCLQYTFISSFQCSEGINWSNLKNTPPLSPFMYSAIVPPKPKGKFMVVSAIGQFDSLVQAPF